MSKVEEHDIPIPPDPMADMTYQTAPHYIQPQYYTSPQVNHGHVVSPPPRAEVTARKRPKYTRSKTGCLTCRVKKIKCDETKPNCMRCSHGQRDCTWPENVPSRKKNTSTTPRKESNDGRPSTAGSSGISEGSTPPTRSHTPPMRAPVDVGLPPLASRRPEPYMALHSVHPEAESVRRHSSAIHDRHPGPTYHHSMQQPPPSNPILSMIPEITAYPQPRYEHSYPNGSHAAVTTRHSIGASARSMGHQSVNQWASNPSHLMPPLEHLEPYYRTVQERPLVGHSSLHDHHARYQ